MRAIEWIGYACGMGAGDRGCQDGPTILLADVERARILSVDETDDDLAAIVDISNRLASEIIDCSKKGALPVVIGGDHSCALGTWSGVSACDPGCALLWVDAHLDCHTVHTSPSDNIHGMPVAALLGFGEPALTAIMQPGGKIDPQRLCLFGVRSYESEERALLERLQVKVLYMDDIDRMGMGPSLQEALDYVGRYNRFGISVDLDAFDPITIQAVGTPVPGGLAVDAFEYWLRNIPWPREKLRAVEIAEYNPHRDRHGETALWTHRILKTLTTV